MSVIHSRAVPKALPCAHGRWLNVTHAGPGSCIAAPAPKQCSDAASGGAMDRKTRIAVIGAGLGGMTVAGLLQRQGFAITVYEQAPAFSRIGAGIILSANAMKVLRRLEIEQAVVDTGIKATSYVSRAWDTGEVQDEVEVDAASEVWH